MKGANSSDVIGTVKTRMTEIEKSLPEGLKIVPFLDRSKLVSKAISTVATNLIGTDAFQEADIWNITAPVVKHNFLVKNTNDLPRIGREAYHIATTGRPGPVLIDIPKDISQAAFTGVMDEPMDLPEVGPPKAGDAVEKYRAKRAALFADYEKHLDACVTKAKQLLRELAPEYLRYLVEESPNHRTVEGFIPLVSVSEAFREAMTAPSLMPEFKGNVFAVPTAPFWSEELGAIDDKRAQVRQMGHYLNSKHKDHANADGHMTEAEKREYLKNYEAKLISPAEEALWKRGASNAGYHYLGCAKTFALMGKAFAEVLIKSSAP